MIDKKKINPHIKIDSSWIDIPRGDTHRSEFAVVWALNTKLMKAGIPVISRRVPCDTTSEQDIEVYKFDLDTLVEKEIILNIDVERKYQDVFEWPNLIPYRWSRGVSFLNRKTKRQTSNSDVYLLCDKNCGNGLHNPNPKILWMPLGCVRKCAVRDYQGSEENDFWVIKKHDYSKILVGMDSLVDYINLILTDNTRECPCGALSGW